MLDPLDAFFQCADLRADLGQGSAQGIGQARVGIFNQRPGVRDDWWAPTGITKPNSRSRPRRVLMVAVGVLSQAERKRCREASVWSATDLTGTGRMSSLR